MSEQGDALVRQILGVTGDMGFWESLQYLRQHTGSGRKTAAAAGVGKTTVQRWIARQATPSAANRAKVMRAAREASTPAAAPENRFNLKVVRTEPRRRDRSAGREGQIPAHKLQLRPGTLDRARAAYVATGNTDRALAVFVGGVGNDFYQTALIPRELRDDEEFMAEFDFEDALPDDYGIAIA